MDKLSDTFFFPGYSESRLAFSVPEVREMFPVSKDILYREMREGRLPYIKIGGRMMVRKEALIELIQKGRL